MTIIKTFSAHLTCSSILTYKRQVHGPHVLEDSTTRDCTTMLLMFLRIPLGLLQRNVPRIYLIGGQCEYFLFSSLEQLINSDGKENLPDRLPSSPVKYVTGGITQDIQTTARSPRSGRRLSSVSVHFLVTISQCILYCIVS